MVKCIFMDGVTAKNAANFFTYQLLTMVNKRHKNRFFAVKIIAQKGVFVIYPDYGCVKTNPNHFEFFCFVASNNNIYSRFVRFGRFYDLFFSN